MKIKEYLRKAMRPVLRVLILGLCGLISSSVAEAAEDESTTGSEPQVWFTEGMLNEAFIVRPPVDKLGGRFMLFASDWFIAKFGYERARMNCRQLRWMGVTDILYHDQSGARINHPTDIKGAKPRYSEDHLMTLVRAAHDEGLNVWAFCHSGEYAEEMCARDANGKFYLYGDHPIDDVFSDELRDFLGQLMDEYAGKYNKYGNFKGLYYDEVFFNYVDFHGDDIDRFDAFCREHFGESLPEDIGERIARGMEWRDPQDVWWRRYILFNNRATTDFMSDLTRMAHERGLQMMIELRPVAGLKAGWAFGMDNVNLARIGADYNFVASGDYCEPGFPYQNSMVGAHVSNSWGYYNTISMRGHEAGCQFVFNQIWRPVSFGLNPNMVEASQQHALNAREWSNAESLTHAALLTNEIGLLLRHGDATGQSENELNVLDRLSHYQDLDMVYTQATELHDRYRTLIALPESTQGIEPAVMDKLRQYVRDGGTIISLGAKWTTSRADLTQEKDATSEMLGVSIVSAEQADVVELPDGSSFAASSGFAVERVSDKVEIMAKFSASGAPAVTRYQIGDGLVIGVHFDPYKALDKPEGPAEAYLARLIADACLPEIRASGEAKIVTTLKKGNWVAVSLYASDFPVSGTVSIDTERLGLKGDAFRLLSHARNREYAPPGDFFGRNFWTREMLAAGVKFTIPVRSDQHLRLPDTLELAEYPKDDADWIRNITQKRWVEPKRSGLRKYDHEILVIAPIDEVMSGEKLQ